MFVMNLLAPVLLLLALSGCSSEVVNSFIQTCPKFFANPEGIVSPPTIFAGYNYKQICQIRASVYEYATLYDTANRIPIYSAYKFESLSNCERQTDWYIEPQLDNASARREMALETNKTLLQNQAVNKDYANRKTFGLDIGHLAPIFRGLACSDATFTLTNAAPQNSIFKKGKWKATEIYVAVLLKQKCSMYDSYVVTGVVPGSVWLNNRVNVPNYVWIGYCCLANNRQTKLSGGFIGRNADLPVSPVNLKELEKYLSQFYMKPFYVFGGRCYLPGE
ncbi:endonuclease domain-containing 1 protein-like [Pygocentrus nattereri]|uniref:Uncharacterized protein n=1 Tax=Pygocentrus nattereri TaxID=42514 RepID=A0A3B4DZU9_PYGNA|nr:endonuclease domain-containing 1 protein-like [Pygocentrus nattereri]